MPDAGSSPIHDLVARLAHAADEGDIEDYLALFTEDAVWELASATPAGASADRRVGRADIRAGVEARRASGIQGPGSHTRHVITTFGVHSLDGDEATGVCYWLFFTDTLGAPKMSGIGRYDDVYRRVDGRWLIAHRVIGVG